MKKKSLPLLVKNALLLVLCGLPGALSNSEVNDLQSTIHQNKATLYPHTTSSVDQELRRNLPGSSSTPKSTQRQHWNTADPLKINTWGSPTQKIQPKEQSEEEDEEDDIEKVTTVHMPTYFSYSTTRRANYRDRSNITNNVLRDKIVSSGRKNQDGEDSYTNNEPRSRIVNNTIKNQDGDASEEDSYSTPATNNGRRKKQDGDGNEEDSYTTTNNEPRSRFMNSRRKKQDGGSDGEDSHTTDITSNEPTMTYSSDILKLNTNRSRTSTRFTSPTTDETPTKYPSSSTSRGSRILTGRRKVNNGEEVSTQSDRFSNLERIQQQLQASTFGPTSTAGLPVRLGQGYHDVEYKVEVKKKPLKKDTEGVSEGDKMSPIVVGGKTGEKQHFIKESKQPESGKMKEPLINETQRTDRPEVLNDKFSTIIDTLSKGNINVPSDKLIKNVTINNEPGTNLLETDNVGGGSKESNEKRDTKGNNDDEVKSGISDVIPVIIKNSVVGEGVSDLVNKTSGFKYPVGDDKTRNESLYLSSTLMTSVNDPQELSKGSSSQDGTKVSQPELESEGANAKIVQSKLSPGLLSSTVGKTEAEKDDLEVKKKAYNLKKPLLPSSGGKVEDSFGGKVEDSIGGKVGDSFEVISKNNSTADDDIIIPYYSSSVPSFTLFNKLNNTRMNEENRTKINELQKTRISSSTSRITSTFSSSSRTNLGLVNNNEEYTTFTSNNLENNIITTSSPMLYGFTSTTPRVNHYFSLRTTTTVQSQPATSAGENLIKQITSFNLRKRPVTYHSPFSVSSTERVQNQSEMVNFNKTYANSEQAYRSGSSMRPSTISKIFPWSTSLQETLTMPQTTTAEITTDDYSDETTTPFTQPSSSRSRISTTAFPNWQESPTTSSSISEDSTNHEASSSTYSIPAATFTSSSTSETPSSSILLPATIESSSKASAPANIEPLSRFRTSSPATIETSRRALSRFESVTPSSQSYSSLSSRTSESPTIIDLLDSSENSTFTMRDVSTSESPSSTSDTISTSEFLPKTSDTKSSEAPSRTSDTASETGDLPSGIQKTTSEFPPKTSDSTSETGDLEIDIRKTNKTAVFYSSSDSAPTSSYNSSLVETEKYEDGFDSTTWYTSKEDGNSTEDLQFGDADRNNQGWIMKSTTSVSTPVNSSVESSEDGLGSTKLEGEPTVSTFFGGSFGGNLDDISSTSSLSTLRPNETSKWGQNRTPSSNSLRTTSRPYVTSTSRHNTTILGFNSTLRPYITSNSGQNLTSIVHSNLTSTPRPTSPSAQETEDVFDPDDEEIHTTTTFSTDAEYEHGNNEEEDDKTNGSGAQTTLKPSKDNRIVKNGNKSKEDGEKTTTVSSERGNFIMKIPTTTEETPLWTHFWTTDVDDGKPTTVPKVTEIPVAATSSPPPAEKVRPLATTGRPIRPVTIEPDLATSPPQYMGLALLVKGATLQEICDEQESLKKAIIFLFHNATGRTLYEDQIAFPSLTANECEGPRKTMNGFHNIDLVLYDENGNFDEELNTEFRMLWERNGLRTKIAIHDVYLILRPSDDVQTSTMTIAVIVISCIGLACLLLFFILMMILRKRQKKFNYGQRCTPVSLDDYSLDNISVYNSMRRKNTRRASKRSYGNPAFDDPSAPSHQMNFAALAHFSTNRKAMDDEFSEIPMVNAKMDELLPGAETRNRYANVIPLPETRVQLAVREGDDPVTGYINANYVKGPKGASKFYIACQAPMQSTVNDFWRMVWEQQSKLILMLTDLHENGVEKCFDYLPPSEVLDCHRLFGDYQVTLKKREVKEKYVISHLQLKNLDSNLWREVTHLWYTSWPHQGVPSEATSIIAYLIEARAHMRNTAGPHIVHCSPGVGRTGTVLAIDLCIREFETSRMVDVPKTVYGLRRNRAGCVQTKDQYAFIYTVLNVYGTKLTGGALDSM